MCSMILSICFLPMVLMGVYKFFDVVINGFKKES